MVMMRRNRSKRPSLLKMVTVKMALILKRPMQNKHRHKPIKINQMKKSKIRKLKMLKMKIKQMKILRAKQLMKIKAILQMKMSKQEMT